MNRFLIASLLCGFAFAASAQTVTISAEEGDAQTTRTQPADGEGTLSERNCLRQTGSRITARDNARAAKDDKSERRCAIATGRVYTREDIDRTGETDIADALRRLDTSIR